MLLIRAICSDDECTEEIEVLVESLEDIAEPLCDCGFGTVTIQIAEVQPV